MLSRICLSLAMLVAIPVWSQVEPSASGAPTSSGDQMQMPPSVSGESYPTAVGSESKANDLRAGLNVQIAYDDNVLEGDSTTPVGDVNYSIRPLIAFDQTTSRIHQSFLYTPGFILYQHTTSQNEVDQSVSESFQYRLTRHAGFSIRDSFQKTTNAFNQTFGGVSGSTQPPSQVVVAPFAEQLHNVASGELGYQFDRNGMIGGGGSFSTVNYPNPTQASGLANSNSRGGQVFYNLRLSSAQSMGVTYQYSSSSASEATTQSKTQSQTLYGFYSLHVKDSVTLSVSGGPQYSVISQSSTSAPGSWTPAITASMGWQKSHTNLAGSYSRTVSDGGGLLGAFESNSGSAIARVQLSRTWTAGLSGNYAITENVTPAQFVSSSGGHSISATVTVQYLIREHLTANFGYARLHQSYSGIGAISQNPNSDSEYISISYQLSRPLGR